MAGRPKGIPKTGGRQKGVSNKATTDLKAIAREHTPKAIQTLLALMERDDSPATQLGAVKEIFDRAYGKATQPLAGDSSMDAIRTALTVAFINPGQDGSR